MKYMIPSTSSLVGISRLLNIPPIVTEAKPATNLQEDVHSSIDIGNIVDYVTSTSPDKIPSNFFMNQSGNLTRSLESRLDYALPSRPSDEVDAGIYDLFELEKINKFMLLARKLKGKVLTT